MNNLRPDPDVTIDCQPVEVWLASDLPAWAKATRQNARGLDPEGVFVLTASTSSGPVGYLVFDRALGHVHYAETRKDQRRIGIAGELWDQAQDEIAADEVTAFTASEEGAHLLEAWGFTTDGSGMWAWRRNETATDVGR